MDCWSYLHRVGHLFKASWDQRRFGTCNPELAEGEEHSVNPNVITQLVRDEEFWAYTQMLLSLGLLTEVLASWCEDIPCHSNMFRGSISKQQRAYRRMLSVVGRPLGDAGMCCPMKGKRAPEMTLGEHKVFFFAASSLHHQGQGPGTVLPKALSASRQRRSYSSRLRPRSATLCGCLQCDIAICRRPSCCVH